MQLTRHAARPPRRRADDMPRGVGSPNSMATGDLTPRGSDAARKLAARLQTLEFARVRPCGAVPPKGGSHIRSASRNAALQAAAAHLPTRQPMNESRGPEPHERALRAPAFVAAASVSPRAARSRPHIEHFVARAPGCADRAELTALPTGLGAHRLWSPKVGSGIPLKLRQVARACEQTWGQIGARDAA